MNDIYTTLPEGYKNSGVLFDAEKKKTGIILISVSIFITFLVLYVFFISDKEGSLLFLKRSTLIYSFLVLFFYSLYVILHELVHGLAYRLFTKQKLKFGFTGLYAYCSVPDIFISKKVYLVSASAPLAIFSILFILLMSIFKSAGMLLSFYFVVILFAFHLGGCAGDMYLIMLLLIKYKKVNLLTRDEGTKSFLYLPMNELEDSCIDDDTSSSAETQNTGEHSKTKDLLIVIGLTVLGFFLGFLFSFLI